MTKIWLLHYMRRCFLTWIGNGPLSRAFFCWKWWPLVEVYLYLWYQHYILESLKDKVDNLIPGTRHQQTGCFLIDGGSNIQTASTILCATFHTQCAFMVMNKLCYHFINEFSKPLPIQVIWIWFTHLGLWRSQVVQVLFSSIAGYTMSFEQVMNLIPSSYLKMLYPIIKRRLDSWEVQELALEHGFIHCTGCCVRTLYQSHNLQLKFCTIIK